MIGTTRPAPLFSKIADRLAPISNDLAAALKDAGVVAVGRYLENLTAFERDGLFTAGLGILLLSEAPVSLLTDTLGHARAAGLLQHAAALGAPTGLHVMIDLEAQQGTVADVTGYINAISGDLARAGYIPLAYVGAGQRLTGSELYALPDVHLYWRGGSRDMAEPTCEFAVWQIPPLEQTIGGGVIDMSITGADLRGRRPILWYPN